MLPDIPAFDKVEKVRYSLLDTKLGFSKCDIHVKDGTDKGHSCHFLVETNLNNLAACVN